MPFKEYVLALRPPIEGSIAMTVAVLLLRQFLPANQPLALRVILEIAGGAGAYAGTLLLLHRERMLTFLRLAGSLRRRRK